MGMAWISARVEWRRRRGAPVPARRPRRARRRGDDRRRGRRPPGRHGVRPLRRTRPASPTSRPTASPAPAAWSREPRRRGATARSPPPPPCPASCGASASPPSPSPRPRTPTRSPSPSSTRPARRHHPFMVEGRMFDPDDPHEVVVNEAGAEAFGVGVGDRLVLGTDRLGPARRVPRAEPRRSSERTGPTIEVTVTGIHRSAVDIAQQDDPFVTLSRAFVERYGDRGDPLRVHRQLRRRARARGRGVGWASAACTSRSATRSTSRRAARSRSTWRTASTSRSPPCGCSPWPPVSPASWSSPKPSPGRPRPRPSTGTSRPRSARRPGSRPSPACWHWRRRSSSGRSGRCCSPSASSALTPRGLARRAEIDPGVRIDPLVLTIGAAAILGLGGAILVAATRRSVRPRPSGVAALRRPSRAASVRPACSGSRWRPARRSAGGWRPAAPSWRPRWASPACSACGRSRPDASAWCRRAACSASTPTWRGAATADDAERRGRRAAACQAASTPSACAGRWTPTSSSTGPGGSATGNPSALDAVTGWAGPDDRPRPRRGRARRGRARAAASSTSSASTSVTRCVSSGPGGDAALTVVGEVVAWGDRRGRRRLRGVDGRSAGARPTSPATAAFGCDPTVQYVVARTRRSRPADAELAAAGFAPVPLPSEIDNLDEAGPLPWLLAAFLAALAVAGLLHAARDRAARPPPRRRDRAGARADDRRGAIGGAVGGGRRWRSAGVADRRAARDRRRAGSCGPRTADRLGVVLEHGLPWWAPVVTALGAIAVTLALAELPARRSRRASPDPPRRMILVAIRTLRTGCGWHHRARRWQQPCPRRTAVVSTDDVIDDWSSSPTAEPVAAPVRAPPHRRSPRCARRTACSPRRSPSALALAGAGRRPRRRPAAGRARPPVRRRPVGRRRAGPRRAPAPRPPGADRPRRRRRRRRRHARRRDARAPHARRRGARSSGTSPCGCRRPCSRPSPCTCCSGSPTAGWRRSIRRRAVAAGYVAAIAVGRRR